MLPEDQTATTDQGQAEATVTTEAADSQDKELNALLSEYKVEGTEPAPETTTEKPTEPDLASLTAKIDRLAKSAEDERAERLSEKVTAEIGKVVDGIRGFSDTLANFPRKLIESHIRDRAREDARITQAFNDKFVNPEGWKRIERALAKEVDAMVSSVPDPKLTGDRKAAMDAVKGQSPQRPAGDSDGPTHAEISAMSDSQFKAHKAKEFAKPGR